MTRQGEFFHCRIYRQLFPVRSSEIFSVFVRIGLGEYRSVEWHRRVNFSVLIFLFGTLLIATSLFFLLLWDGHANVKFAGHVNLFEYLYKYIFKGPDYTLYDMPPPERSDDEIADWLRGRYLCATECMGA